VTPKPTLPVVEPAPEEPLTLDHMMAVARRNGHQVFSGDMGYECSVEYAAGCRRCGAYCTWMDLEQTMLRGTFTQIWNKPCPSVTPQA
jgi:hypothetical protein